MYYSCNFINNFPVYFCFLIISAIRGIILSPLLFCFSNISDYLLFILLMKPFFSSRISLLAHLLFLRCLPPFIRTKRRFVGFSRWNGFLSVTAAKFSLFPLSSIESGLKKGEKGEKRVYNRRRRRWLENCSHHARVSWKISPIITRLVCFFSCHSAEKRECGQRNNNTRVLLTH